MSDFTQKPGRGYPDLAKIMGPHNGMSLFKRFASLNAKNTLYMQAELLDLERQLDNVEKYDKEQEGLPYYREALTLVDCESNGMNPEQWRLVLRIREKLREYNNTLIEQAQISNLAPANGYDLQILRDWLMNPEHGANFLPKIEDRPWRATESADLVALSSRKHDVFTGWIAERLIPWLSHRLYLGKTPISDPENTGLIEWKDAKFSTFSRALSALTSTLIPSVAVVSLYFIRNLLARIFAAMGFSAILSLVLVLLTTARPAEIFAATVAFASVQVVFIGSTTVK